MNSDSNLALSSRLSIGDYIPHTLIETTEQRLDIQSKAGEPNVFVVLSEAHGALASQALGLTLPYRHFVLTETASDSAQHKRIFPNAAFCRLFLHPLVPISAFVTDANLKIVDYVDAQNLDELQAELAEIRVPTLNLPAPVLVIPNAIDEWQHYRRAIANNVSARCAVASTDS